MDLPTRISESFQARVVRPWTLRHFDRTRWGRAIAGYRNRYAGRRCFLIGNGPSLRASDLTALHRRGEICFGFNRIYHIFPETPWRPDFYLCQDEKLLRGSLAEVRTLDLPVKFIPIEHRWYHDLSVKDAVYFHLIHQEQGTPEAYRFSENPTKGLYNASTCLYSAAQLAVYMGFETLYLLGVDHRFHISQDDRGRVTVDEAAKDYFTDAYNPDRASLNIPNLDRSTRTFQAMGLHCDARGVSVYNATRGGCLEVFPRADLDALLTSLEEP